MSQFVSDIHPREYRKYLNKRRSLFKLDYLQNPLPNAVRDSKALQRIFASFPYIPYSTNETWTSHRLVDLLWNMTYLSSTHSACIKAKKDMAFGGKIRFSRSMEDIYDLEDEKVYLQGNDLMSRIEMLSMVEMYGMNLLQLIQKGYHMYETTGDIWIELKLASVGGQNATAMEVHDNRNVLLKLQTEEEEGEGIEYAAICMDWELAQTTEPIRHVALYPNFNQDEDGVYHTMIHHKCGIGDFYGRPPTQGAIVSQYNEYQDSIYLLKIGRKNFTGQVIYEFEDDGSFQTLDENAQDDGYLDFGDQLEKNMTNEADEPMTVLAHTRPFGSRPSTLHQIKPSTSETWHQVTKDIYRERIILSHQWSERLLGLSVANGWDSNVYWDEAILKLMTVIKPLRNAILTPFNLAMYVISEWMGEDPDIQLDVVSLADEMLEQKMEEKERMKKVMSQPNERSEEDPTEEEEEEEMEEPEEESEDE